MLHPLIYESWTPPDHVCLIIHGAAAAPLAQPLCPWQPLPPPCFHPKHVTTHAKLCQPPATSLGGDCLQVVCHLVVVTVHRAPDCWVFYVSVLVFILLCACRSRWSPCMSHEALSGHTCNLPSFLPSKPPTKGEVVKLAPTTFDRCGRWFESQCRHTLSVLGGYLGDGFGVVCHHPACTGAFPGLQVAPFRGVVYS